MSQRNYQQEANLLMTYASQLDHLLLANDATLDIWVDELGGLDPDLGKDIIKNFYKRQMPHDRMTITPRYIRQEAQRRIRRALGSNAYCKAHVDYFAGECPVCAHEITAGIRNMHQQGQILSANVPPPQEITRTSLGESLKVV